MESSPPSAKRHKKVEVVDGGAAAVDSPSESPSDSPPLPSHAAPEELLPAAKRGDAAVVASALRNPRTNPNMIDGSHSTALILAADNSHLLTLDALLADRRVDVNAEVGFLGCTALMRAAEAGNAAVASRLLADPRRVYPNYGRDNGNVAIYMASSRGHTAVVALLLAHDRLDPNIPDPLGNTALKAAIFAGHTAVVALLLADERVDPDVPNVEGCTALRAAASGRRTPMLRLLLANERTTRARPTTGDGGLYYDAALAWLRRRGTADEAGPEEYLPAAEEGDAAIVASALRNPLTDPNATGRYGTTALIFAANNNGRATGVMASLLADERVDPNATDDRGRSALLTLVNEMNVAWASPLRDTIHLFLLLLADERVDPNIADLEGMTPLSYTAARCMQAPQFLFCAEHLQRDLYYRKRRRTILRQLLANPRIVRQRPAIGGEYYDAALSWVTRHSSANQQQHQQHHHHQGGVGGEAGAGAGAAMNGGGAPADAAPEELIVAAKDGDDATVASALRNPLVDPNMVDEHGVAVLLLAARYHRPSVLRLLLGDSRVRRTHPGTRIGAGGRAYDDALRAVKRRRNARFKGVIRGYVVLRRMRLRAAQAVYAPGGAGFATAAASFSAAVAVSASSSAAAAGPVV